MLSLLPILLLLTPSLASVTCVTVSTTATATWVNAASETCTFAALVGGNFGDASADGTAADYSCNGRCGAGCTGTALGDFYTQDCFSHDICSYFNNSTTAASDPNCGAAYDAAEDDYLLGGVDGCGQTNPTISAEIPTGKPVCV